MHSPEGSKILREHAVLGSTARLIGTKGALYSDIKYGAIAPDGGGGESAGVPGGGLGLTALLAASTF